MEEPENNMFLFQPGVDLREIVDAVNQVEPLHLLNRYFRGT